MEFTFHNLYVILEHVPSTEIFWKEVSCWRKSYSNKATLLQGWSHRYKHSSVVITIWSIVTKYPDLNDNGSFAFYVDIFYHCQDFYRTWLYICVTWRVSYKKQELLTRREYPSSPRFLVGFALLIFYICVLSYYVSLRS